ncbi:MAG: hypothetical protein IRZ08_15685, partial [Frankia sp.]|nr:hypothetical protein [Frankia sp.]
MTRKRPRRPDDHGQATAELVMGLPAMTAVVGLVLWLLAAANAQARADEAARIGARAAARGDSDELAAAWARAAAPAGTRVTIDRRGDRVLVRVEVTYLPGSPLRFALAGTATAPAEPTDWPLAADGPPTCTAPDRAGPADPVGCDPAPAPPAA